MVPSRAPGLFEGKGGDGEERPSPPLARRNSTWPTPPSHLEKLSSLPITRPTGSWLTWLAAVQQNPVSRPGPMDETALPPLGPVERDERPTKIITSIPLRMRCGQ